MKRILAAGFAAALLVALTACMPHASFVPDGTRAPRAPRLPRLPAVLAAQDTTAGAADETFFAIAEVGPSGTIPHENLEGGLWVLFNRPVVALTSLQKPATSSPFLTISPRIEGVYRWYGSRLYSFEPKGPLSPATEYTFSVAKTLRSLAGEQLKGDTRFSFRTEPLGVVSLSPTGDDVPPEETGELVVTFNFPVDLKTIVASLHLQVNGADVPFKASRPAITDRRQLGPYENADRLVSLKPARELPRDADVTLVVRAGARPRPENYGTDADITVGFHTLRPLAVEDSQVVMGRDGATAELRFNHPLNQDNVAGNLRLDLPGYDLAEHLEVSGAWVLLHEVPVDFESTLSLTVRAGMADIYAQQMGADLAVSMETGSAASYVDFRGTGQKILEAQFPPRVAVEMQNVDEGRYVAGRISSPFAALPTGPEMPIDTTKIPRNQRHFEVFDLSQYLNSSGKGTAFISWALSGLFWGSEEPQEVKDSLVVQVTDIGASVHVGWNTLTVVATSLSKGAPVADATVTLRKEGTTVASGRTDAKGMATLALASGVLLDAFRGVEERAELEIAKGKDRLVLRPSEMPCETWNSTEPYSAELPRPLTYLWADRGIYRPGEKLSFAGIDRDLVTGTLKPVSTKWRVELTNGSEDSTALATAGGTSSASGSFSGQVSLPKDMEPGDWLLVFHRLSGKNDEKTGTAYVQVANFRRVAFAVDITLPDQRKFMGDTLEGKLSGSYLAGGNVAKGKWSWFWTRRETWYQPPVDAFADYSFGAVEKGWAEDLGSENGSLAGTGVVTPRQALADGEKGRVYTYEVVGTIEDVDRQAISKRASTLVFSSQQLIGAKLTAEVKSDDSLYFVKKGQPFTLKTVSVDPDGKPYPSGTVSGRLVREEWKLVRERSVGAMVDTHYEKELVEEKTFTVKTGTGPAVTPLSTQKPGSYAIELSGKDAKGRESFTRITFYSTGAEEILWERSDERRLEMVPDRKVYAPGDTARLLVKSPLAKGTYLLSVEREGVIEQKAVDLVGGAPTIEIPITEDHVPIVYVFLSTSLPRTRPPADGPDTPDFGKPRGYSGLVELPVTTASRSIKVEMTNSQDSYLPGREAAVTIKASVRGTPLAGAEIVLVAADRGVLDLIDYHVPSPVDFFYSRSNFPDRVAHYDSRDLLLDPVTWKSAELPGGDEKGEPAPAAGVSVRKDFNPTAVFRTGLVTGKDGTVTAKFKLPDLLTRFRSTAVAVKDDRFGMAEGELLVQNPINVRTALPRRMRVGDAATAGVVLTNLDGKAHVVSVGLSAQGLTLKGANKLTVTLKPGETSETAFALESPTEGTAHLAFNVDSDILKERLEDTLTVFTEHVNESFTIVGKTVDTAKEGFAMPAAFLGTPEEGLYLSVDSTIASSLAGAVKFLDLYPYDCLEQVTSKLFARVLFPQLAGPGTADLSAVVPFANPDGGFSYWNDPAPRRSNYYVSLRVAHLVAAARERKMKIPAGIDVEALLKYIGDGWQDLRSTYLQSYALYVLSAWGRHEQAKADALASLGDGIGVFGYGFLGLSYDLMGDKKSAQKVLTRLKSFVRVGTRTVTLVGTVDDWLWYGGDLQAKALLLMLYARLQPDSQLVLGLANDLLARSKGGHWQNTSNAGWVLQAFSEVVGRGGEANSNFTATVSLGANELVKKGFKGFSKSPFTRQVTVKELTDIVAQAGGKPGAAVPLQFGVAGKGTLYYTAEVRYSLAAQGVEPRDEGIGIAFEVIDGKGKTVSGTELDPGTVYPMRVVFYSSRDRTFVALRAPIPSGAEPIDGSLVTSQVVKAPAATAPGGDEEDGGDAGYQGDYGESGYTTKIYDGEVRFFFDKLDRGKHEVSFLLRTTTPGLYPTPPVQAELMYQPEVFGRTAGTVWRIKE
jgi:alpha-2-macroglobulin